MTRGHSPSDSAVTLRDAAREAGLSRYGVVAPDPSEHIGYYRRWLDEGRHGAMAYLARPDAVARRADLTGTMEEVRSVIVVADGYDRDEPGGPDERAAHPSRAVIARYARGGDYHDVLLAKLSRLLAGLDTRTEGGVRGRAYVDTGPILERDLGRRAGLGWFGRNTMLIDPRRGSYFFIGVLLVDLDLPRSQPFEADRCGTCRSCLDACPTGALLGRDDEGAPVIDARRCISYLTIELRGPIPSELRAGIGNRIFGCDICQEVCPFTRFSGAPSEPSYAPRADLDGPPLAGLAERLLAMSGRGFRRAFAGSPLLRARRDGLLRNVCVALGNGGSPDDAPVLERALADRSPLVRGHAAWALGRIGTQRAVEALTAARGTESEADVRAEISAALLGACITGTGR